MTDNKMAVTRDFAIVQRRIDEILARGEQLLKPPRGLDSEGLAGIVDELKDLPLQRLGQHAKELQQVAAAHERERARMYRTLARHEAFLTDVATSMGCGAATSSIVTRVGDGSLTTLQHMMHDYNRDDFSPASAADDVLPPDSDCETQWISSD